METSKRERVLAMKAVARAKNRARRRELSAFSKEHKIREKWERIPLRSQWGGGVMFELCSEMTFRIGGTDETVTFRAMANTQTKCQEERNRWVENYLRDVGK